MCLRDTAVSRQRVRALRGSSRHYPVFLEGRSLLGRHRITWPVTRRPRAAAERGKDTATTGGMRADLRGVMACRAADGPSTARGIGGGPVEGAGGLDEQRERTCFAFFVSLRDLIVRTTDLTNKT